MKIVLQRVINARVDIHGETVGEIGKGYLLLLGIGQDDTPEIIDKMLEKVSRLRIFEDENGKTNLDIHTVGGEILVVSQFTLYADCRKGNRPGFTGAAAPDMAESLYEYALEKCRELFGTVACGRFGADMQVSLVNDGPFTVLLDSAQILPH